MREIDGYVCILNIDGGKSSTLLGPDNETDKGAIVRRNTATVGGKNIIANGLEVYSKDKLLETLQARIEIHKELSRVTPPVKGLSTQEDKHRWELGVGRLELSISETPEDDEVLKQMTGLVLIVTINTERGWNWILGKLQGDAETPFGINASPIESNGFRPFDNYEEAQTALRSVDNRHEAKLGSFNLTAPVKLNS